MDHNKRAILHTTVCMPKKVAVRGQTTNEAFWDASGRIQAAGSGGVARAAPNANNMVGVRWTPERKT